MTQSAPALATIILSAQIPTWFEAALNSVLDQDYPHCEILVVDGSNDHYITAMLTPYLALRRYPVRHLTYDHDHPGIYEDAIRVAQGKYLKFISDSELLAPDCISRMVAALETFPQCRVVAAKRQRIDPKDELLEDILSTALLYDRPAILNGRDLLRVQSRQSYSLLGELTASMFFRDDVLALMLDDAPLFAINGERLLGVEGLLIYSKLLVKGDLAWLPMPLCFIRVSEIYQQPHQRESEADVQKARNVVLNWLREQAWHDDTTVPLNRVRLASFDTPQKTSLQNIIAFQHQALDLNGIAWWQAQRRLQPFQQEYLHQIAIAQPGVTRVGVVISVTDENRAQLTLTLASLPHRGLSTLLMQPIIVGTSCTDTADFIYYETGQDNYLATVNQLINEQDHQWFIFLEAGDTFQPSGLIALSTMLLQADNVLAIYGDEFFYIDGKPVGAAFRPDFNLDMLFSSPKLMADRWLFRRELLLAAEGFDLNYPSSAVFDLIVKMIESQGLNVVGHLTEPLLIAALKPRALMEDVAIIERHLHNRGYPHAQIALDSYHNYRLRYQHPELPKVSIAILANWHLPSLIGCVTTLLEKTRYLNYELLIVGDNQVSQEREDWLESMGGIDPQRIKVMHYDGAYQHAAMANLAAVNATGEYLMFMHCELAITDGEWLDNLLNHGQRPEVAVVGGKQLTSQNKIRHAGYLLGVNGAAGEAFRGLDDNNPSYLGRLQLDQNYSAVSGDFMLVRKAVFDALGGFDASHQLYDDVDFCLRARNEGYMTVWTPYARILRPAARSNPFPGESVHTSGKLKQLEEDKLYARWMPLIASDPAFNANLSLKSRHFDVSSDSLNSWTPVQREQLPVFMAHNADTAGCGHYRIMTPFAAMQNEGVADGKLSGTLLSISEMGKIKPDSLIIQRRYAPAFHQWIERTSKLHDVFKVFELDDYILNVPMKHFLRQDFKREITGQLRKSLSYFDRFVVSTEPLAEALGDMHPEIVVVKNRLPVSWWGHLQSLRNQGRKPRVGWAGGASHTGDLEMIVDVVKEFANEVEWVFFGMCPMKLRPYVHEIHHGVDISLYPAKLASLNLDLALAPVEDNLFNSCKSNLRLMEYGVCGIPVICSDVACYRGDTLPVTRVSNRFIDWRDAIRMHLADPDASARMGAELQVAVRRDWMLTGDNVKNWAKAWSAN